MDSKLLLLLGGAGVLALLVMKRKEQVADEQCDPVSNWMSKAVSGACQDERMSLEDRQRLITLLTVETRAMSLRDAAREYRQKDHEPAARCLEHKACLCEKGKVGCSSTMPKSFKTGRMAPPVIY